MSLVLFNQLNSTPPIEITATTKRPDWTWYATGPGAGIELERGAHAGRLVVPCDHIERGTRRYFSHVIFSDDGGATWKNMGLRDSQHISEIIVDQALKTDSVTFTTLLLSSFDFDVSDQLYSLPVPMLVVGSELMFPAKDSSQPMQKIGDKTMETIMTIIPTTIPPTIATNQAVIYLLVFLETIFMISPISKHEANVPFLGKRM